MCALFDALNNHRVKLQIKLEKLNLSLTPSSMKAPKTDPETLPIPAVMTTNSSEVVSSFIYGRISNGASAIPKKMLPVKNYMLNS